MPLKQIAHKLRAKHIGKHGVRSARRIGRFGGRKPRPIATFHIIHQSALVVRIEHLSDAVGYGSASDFYRHFKALFGVSPTAWRNMREREP
ncbi:MAG: AraC family transcriptional regulator [Clostridia bacterium]|nr:AraC family transcriptional regulator [Clostridia bacterium]